MAKFRVIRPWFGVSVGSIIEADSISPAFRPNVQRIAEGELEVASPKATSQAEQSADKKEGEQGGKTPAQAEPAAANTQAQAVAPSRPWATGNQ